MHRIVPSQFADAEEAGLRMPPPGLEIFQPIAVRSAKVLSLLLILEALRQAPVSLDRAKV